MASKKFLPTCCMLPKAIFHAPRVLLGTSRAVPDSGVDDGDGKQPSLRISSPIDAT